MSGRGTPNTRQSRLRQSGDRSTERQRRLTGGRLFLRPGATGGHWIGKRWMKAYRRDEGDSSFSIDMESQALDEETSMNFSFCILETRE
jgi:hypothetical protein